MQNNCLVLTLDFNKNPKPVLFGIKMFNDRNNKINKIMRITMKKIFTKQSLTMEQIDLVNYD